MSRPKIPKHLQKTKVIKLMVTEREFEIYQRAKNRLLNLSPPLQAYKILRKCINHVDDLSLIAFLELDEDSSIKTMLLNDFLFSEM